MNRDQRTVRGAAMPHTSLLLHPFSGNLSSGQTLPSEIRGLLFDLGGVFFDDSLWQRWVLKLLARIGLHTHYDCFFHVWQREHEVAVHLGQKTFCEAFGTFLLAAGLSRGQIDEVLATCQRRRTEMLAETHMFPGVRATLEELRVRGLALGVVCNSEFSATAVRDHLARLGVDRLLTAVLTSADLGRAAPDPLWYAAGLQRLQLPASQVAFVGHDPAELAGAAAVGLTTVGFNQARGAQPDFTIGRFDELLDLTRHCASWAAAC